MNLRVTVVGEVEEFSSVAAVKASLKRASCYLRETANPEIYTWPG